VQWSTTTGVNVGAGVGLVVAVAVAAEGVPVVAVGDMVGDWLGDKVGTTATAEGVPLAAFGVLEDAAARTSALVPASAPMNINDNPITIKLLREFADVRSGLTGCVPGHSGSGGLIVCSSLVVLSTV
jgi:hypothetical protein